MDHVRKNPGVYADMTDLPDYQTALQTVITAQTTFDTIPSNVRHRFDNNPQTFIDFMADPANTDEAVKLGLMIPRPTPTQDVMVTTGGKRTPIPKKENSSDTSEE
jgi:phage internal scaffolding protein